MIQCDFFWKDDQGESLVILTAVDVLTFLMMATVLPSKEFSLFAVMALVNFIYECGRTHGSVQCDEELAIEAIVKGALRKVGGLTFRKAPKGSSQSQGNVERFHQLLFSQARAIRLQVELNFEVKTGHQHPIVTWVVRHAAWLLIMYLIHSNGLTSYQRRWNDAHQPPLCDFGEAVLFRLATNQVQNRKKYESRWFEGLWLGRETSTNEILAGTSTGIFKTRSIRRLPLSDRSPKELLNAIKATPWNHKSDGIYYPRYLEAGSTEATQPEVAPAAGEQVSQEAGEEAQPEEPPGHQLSADAEIQEDPEPSTSLIEVEEAQTSTRPAEVQHADEPDVKRRLVEKGPPRTRPAIDVSHRGPGSTASAPSKKPRVAAALKEPVIYHNSTEFKEEELKEAMIEEKASLDHFDVKEEIPVSQVPPEDLKEAHGLTWVHTWKGFVKSRLCVRGFTQKSMSLTRPMPQLQ